MRGLQAFTIGATFSAVARFGRTAGSSAGVASIVPPRRSRHAQRSDFSLQPGRTRRSQVCNAAALAHAVSCLIPISMSEQTDRDDPTYAYRPSLVGATWSFRLGADALHWDNGGRSGSIGYDAIRRVRLSYRPATMQSHRFLTEIWWRGGPKLRIASTSARSITETARLDREYRQFVLGLHRRLAGKPVQLIGGTNPILFWVGVPVFAATAFGMVTLLIRAVQEGAGVAALLVGTFVALFLWQGGNFFLRNRPVRYAATNIPAPLVPKAS
jgi:hypothetical protein